MRRGCCFAHRGVHFSNHDENTFPSFYRASIIPGFAGFECDVHLSADKNPVIVHDTTLLRTHNLNMSVIESMWSQLKSYIPSAKSVLETFGSANHIIFDLKTKTSKDTMLAMKNIDKLANRLKMHNYSYLVWEVLPVISTERQVLLACDYVFDASKLPRRYSGFACKFDGSRENCASIDAALNLKGEGEPHINLYAPDPAQVLKMRHLYGHLCSCTM